MKTQQILDAATRKERSVIGKFTIVSQAPGVIKEADRAVSRDVYLPMFLLFWQALEEATGFAWKCTSYIRNSPSHKTGQAFDLAPDIADSSTALYAVYNGSDPVLYKREPLIRALQSLRNASFGPVPLGVFIEPDHLHVQVLAEGQGEQFPTSTVKWKISKPIYGDTYDRMQLPMTNHGY